LSKFEVGDKNKNNTLTTIVEKPQNIQSKQPQKEKIVEHVIQDSRARIKAIKRLKKTNLNKKTILKQGLN